ncbi:peptidoglycan DD-metalloendopeptidase family protein [Flavobacteriaceae bacterium M23B6Z8]
MEIFKSKFAPAIFAPIDRRIPPLAYTHIDLSVDNKELKEIDLSNPYAMEAYINKFLTVRNARVAYGGYLEKRNLYKSSPIFQQDSKNSRNIHLGVDFWCAAGTKVITPIDGVVHSFKDNSNLGDYGPTIILKHRIDNEVFYTLYGHLSRTSLKGLKRGKVFKSNETLGTLGTPEENVNYAPHLHFQLIKDIQKKEGDYPGVCNHEQQEFYKQNCPDPLQLLKLGSL